VPLAGRSAHGLLNFIKRAFDDSDGAAPGCRRRPLRSGRRGKYILKPSGQKLGEIEKKIGRGESIKAAVKKAGMSEQTYYQWKKAAGQTIPSDELKDLVTLEEENTRLKKLLADRLRNENAEHRKARGSLESSPGHVESFTSGRMPFCCPLSVATL
jgi:transposase-like protein